MGWQTQVQKYPVEQSLPWTLEPAGCLQWGQSGAGYQQAHTPAVREELYKWSDEPWSESEKCSFFSGWTCECWRCSREKSGCAVITACVKFTLHLLPALCSTLHLSWHSLDLNFCPSSVCLKPPRSLNESDSKATGAMEGKMFLSWPELQDKLLLIQIQCTMPTETYRRDADDF